MVIYIDCVFLLNSLIDGLLLYFTGYLAGVERRIGRLLAAALLGGGYAAAVFSPVGPVLSFAPVHVAAGAALLFVAYGRGQRFGRLLLVFWGVSCALAGVVLACGIWCRTQLYHGGAYLLPVRFTHLAAGAALCFFCLYWFSRGTLRHRMNGEIVKASCEVEGRTVLLRVLLDSGNTLSDTLTGAPVLVAEGAAFLDLWPPEARPYLTDDYLRRPELALEKLAALEQKPQLRLLPYRSVGTSAGMLLVYTARHAEIGNYRREKLAVALSPTPVSEGKEFDALWGGPVA